MAQNCKNNILPSGQEIYNMNKIKMHLYGFLLQVQRDKDRQR